MTNKKIDNTETEKSITPKTLDNKFDDLEKRLNAFFRGASLVVLPSLIAHSIGYGAGYLLAKM